MNTASADKVNKSTKATSEKERRGLFLIYNILPITLLVNIISNI